MIKKTTATSIIPSTIMVTIRIVILHHKSIHTWNSPTPRIFTSASSCTKLLISYGETSNIDFLGSSLAIDINSITHLTSTVNQCPCINYRHATFSYILFHRNSIGSYHAVRIYILPYKENSLSSFSKTIALVAWLLEPLAESAHNFCNPSLHVQVAHIPIR